MPASREEVEKIARLARLSYSEEELHEFVPQFQEIIGYVNHLEELPAEGVKPLYHALSPEEREDGPREDEVRPSLPLESALKNAPEPVEGQFRVPKVIE